jgi:hypothetical protein
VNERTRHVYQGRVTSIGNRTLLEFEQGTGIYYLYLLAVRQPGMKIVRVDFRHLAKWEPPE